MTRILSLLTVVSTTLAAVTAHAWDPNEGADWNTPAAQTNGYKPGSAWSPSYATNSARPFQTQGVAPTLHAPAPAAIQYQPAPVAYKPAPPVTPLPMPPAPAAAPAFQAAPVYTPPPAPMAQAAPAYAVPYTPYQEPSASAYSSTQGWDAIPHDRLALGIEGYYDNYKEDSVDLDNEAINGSITADYVHFLDRRLFAGIDGRVSYGQDDYSSISGEIDGIPVWEYEGRLKGGYRFLDGDTGTVDLYTGLGSKYYDNKFKGESVNGSSGYDRRIFQVYLPVGVTHTTEHGNWTLRKNAEADALLYGNVSSRLGTIPGYGNVENRQKAFTGFGLRGEVTLANLNEHGSGFEFGPFIRYWYADDSENKYEPVSGFTFIEPENTRLQLGLTGRYLF